MDILSQCKKKIIKAKNIEFWKQDDIYIIIADYQMHTTSETWYELGEYETEKRCEDIVNAIFANMLLNKKTYIMPTE